ncbi:MAG: hypothetical protein KAY32_06520 [Candidatus Eisenbacteria sp.]|nr:hypothetical protein [Candidatus Eisenbacteria bacterium]
MRLLSILCGLLALSSICFPALAEGVLFSVRPGEMIQTAHFGLPMGKVTPFFGVDLIAVGVNAHYTDEHEYCYGDYGCYREEEEFDMEASAMVLIPHIGAKFSLGLGKVRPYLFGSVFKAFASINGSGEEIYRSYEDGDLQYEDVDKYEDDEVEEMLEDILGFVGFTIGFGAEYFFSEHFSLGGEYGLRLVTTTGNYEEKTHEDDDSGYYEGSYRDAWEQELSGTLKMSYASIALNYYL